MSNEYTFAEQMEHSVSFCKLDGELWPMLGQKEDLFGVTSQMVRYVVDSNSFEKQEFKKPEYRNKAFILTQTIVDECSDLLGLLFSKKTSYENNNVFVLSVHRFESIGHLLALHRLDRHYVKWFDKNRAPVTSAYERDFHESNKDVRNTVLSLLGAKDMATLPMPETLTRKRAKLLSGIARDASTCAGNYLAAIPVARQCYAALWIESAAIRKEFSESKYPNVFGDCRIIRDALFLQAEILSKDVNLTRMANYAGLRVWHRN